MAEQTDLATSSSGVAKCPRCNAPVIDWRPYGRCSNCKEPFSAEFDARMAALLLQPAAPQRFTGAVVVTDIQMPFGSMVVFMVKWVLASIPAMIILLVLGAIVAALFGGVLAGLLSLAR